VDVHWSQLPADITSLSSIWAPVVDNAVKILGGGAVGFASAWIVARRNAQSALTKELFNRRLDMLLAASQQFENTFDLWIQYLALAEDYQSSEVEIEAIGPSGRVKWLTEAKAACRDLRSAWRLEMRKFDIQLPRLILLNEDSIADCASELTSQMNTADAFFCSRNLGSAEYDTIKNKIIELRFALIDAISRAFMSTKIPGAPTKPRFTE
jgi:hypothetical protein